MCHLDLPRVVRLGGRQLQVAFRVVATQFRIGICFPVVPASSAVGGGRIVGGAVGVDRCEESVDVAVALAAARGMITVDGTTATACRCLLLLIRLIFLCIVPCCCCLVLSAAGSL
jgi:hypothetical protein